jgi:hypothetical protein
MLTDLYARKIFGRLLKGCNSAISGVKGYKDTYFAFQTDLYNYHPLSQFKKICDQLPN